MAILVEFSTEMHYIITGSYPPDVCGVGDYTFCLARELEKQGEKMAVLKPNVNSFIRILRSGISSLFNLKIKNKLLIQYPTA